MTIFLNSFSCEKLEYVLACGKVVLERTFTLTFFKMVTRIDCGLFTEVFWARESLASGITRVGLSSTSAYIH